MRLSIRFQPWIVSLMVLLVLTLTSVFLLTVFGKFQSMAQTNAEERFALVASRATSRLEEMLQSQRRFVDILSRSQPALFQSAGALEPDALVPNLVAALHANDDLYSAYFGLQGGDFLQAVAVRGLAPVAEALGAPAATDHAVRRITRDAGGTRREHWTFFGRDGATLGQRSSATGYNPTTRPWFSGALERRSVYIADPYRFASTGELGLTLSSPLPGGQGVVGVDVTLAAFRAFLDELELSPNGVVVVMDGNTRVLGLSARSPRLDATGDVLLKPLAEVGNPLLAGLDQTGNASAAESQATRLLEVNGEPLVLAHTLLQPVSGRVYRVMTVAPVSDFTGAVLAARRDVLLSSAVILLVLVPLALLGTRQAAQGLRSLANSSERLRHFDFAHRPEPVRSFLYEVDVLGKAQEVVHDSLREYTSALELARAKLAQIVDNGIRLGRERDRDKLLRHVLFGARDIAHCQAATLFIRTEHNTLRFALRTSDDDLPAFEIALHDENGEPVHKYVSTHVALTAESVVIDDVYTETRFDLSGTKKFSEESGMRVVSMLTVPLFPREGEVIGILQLLNCLDSETGEVVPFDPETVGFIEALAAQSAVAIENQNLLLAQKELMDSMIRIIAGAIDAKSAYTGGHCERVPELALMLAEEAAQVKEGPLASFGFHSEDEWSEFRIGAWLHDCGKVTTPEYVVDKATKLETIYNRLHEIRTRFEVLLRDAEIAAHKAVAAGQDADSAWATYEARKAQLQSDFAFVAETNLGGEFMAPERVERIRAIAEQTWWRHFDDRIGLSHDEEQRLEGVPATPLPVQERLLADKAQHIVRRGPDKALDPKYGFQVRVPEHQYNHGEVYNLCIARGTLNDEERFKINEHIIQTIVMLDSMPFPKHLKRVPEYAGTHHETLIGTGYPRKLTAEQMSVPSRIMAIADIFEALTASDRPYKKAKTLSDCIKILSFFKKDKHIDPVLFDLFLTSGVYQRYAERYLKPEQIDTVDIRPYLG